MSELKLEDVIKELQLQIQVARNEAKAAMAQSTILADGFNELVKALENRDMEVEMRLIGLGAQITLIFDKVTGTLSIPNENLSEPSLLDKFLAGLENNNKTEED